LDVILGKAKSAKMGRLRREMLLRGLGFEPPMTRAPEEEAQMRAALAKQIIYGRRMTMTPAPAT
jgi:hypothetical protein